MVADFTAVLVYNHTMNALLDLGLHALRSAYSAGTLDVGRVVEEVLKRIAAAGDDKVWISRVPDPALRTEAARLDARRGEIERMPLYGVPFAVKDNIDVAGLPTTAACPGFAYQPARSAGIVQRLVDAGAIIIGKTNLDQFATGLVGVRSPYGVPKNPFDPAFVPGGSSSGSAVAVATGLASFALGTDTAGSGRVPAGFNNIVGLKPTPGLLGIDGVVPACQSLDCVTVFTLSCADADAVLKVAAEPHATPPIGKAFRFGVLAAQDAEFFGDEAYAALYAQSIERLKALGGTPVAFDYAPFRDAARLLYGGPWVAERTAAVGKFIESADDKAGVWPTTRQIVLGGRTYSAVDAFEGQYRLADLKARAETEMKGLDLLALPTAGTIYRLSDLEREPLLYNTNLGHYTNFVNFFGFAALALPAGFRPDGLPFGITLIGRAHRTGAAGHGARGDRRRAAAAGQDREPTAAHRKRSRNRRGSRVDRRGRRPHERPAAERPAHRARRSPGKRRQDRAGLPLLRPARRAAAPARHGEDGRGRRRHRARSLEPAGHGGRRLPAQDPGAARPRHRQPGRRFGGGGLSVRKPRDPGRPRYHLRPCPSCALCVAAQHGRGIGQSYCPD